MEHRIRIGIVGAGANTRLKHIPGLRAIPAVEVVSVANRAPESSRRAARELGIPVAHDSWLDLVESEEIDAVVIGTWPYMHAPVTLAALDNSKHVLVEARMAMNSGEAHMMLDASRSRPDLVAQLVPAPHTLVVDRHLRELTAGGYLGELLSVDMAITTGAFVDRESPLHWRQDADLSGLNALTMGIWYEALMRWVGPAARVMARTRVTVPRRMDASGELHAVTVPDQVNVVADMACGAVASMRFSAVTGLHERSDVYLYGTDGTLHWDGLAEVLRGGRRGDEALTVIEIPADRRGRWRVEQEFVNAIRGLERVEFSRFEDGVRYMEFTDAVARSAQTGQAVDLPFV